MLVGWPVGRRDVDAVDCWLGSGCIKRDASLRGRQSRLRACSMLAGVCQLGCLLASQPRHGRQRLHLRLARWTGMEKRSLLLLLLLVVVVVVGLLA